MLNYDAIPNNGDVMILLKWTKVHVIPAFSKNDKWPFKNEENAKFQMTPPHITVCYFLYYTLATPCHRANSDKLFP